MVTFADTVNGAPVWRHDSKSTFSFCRFIPMGSLNFLGYAVCSLAYLVVAVLAATAPQRSEVYRYFVMALLGQTIWSAILLLDLFLPSPKLFVGAELIRVSGWFFFLTEIFPRSELSPHPWLGRFDPKRKVQGALIVLVILCVFMIAFDETAGPTPARGTATLAGLLLSVTGLLLTEQVYSNVPKEHRWGLKFMCLAIVALFGYDLFFYADVMVGGEPSPHLAEARGYINTLVAPILLLSVARSSSWTRHLTFSRQVAFHSATFVVVAIYLLGVSMMSYYARYWGGSRGVLIQIVLLFAAVLFLALVSLSVTFRARLRVLLNKHFFSSIYDYREEWLTFTSSLSAGNDLKDVPRRVVLAICDLVDSPAGGLWVVGEDHTYNRLAEANMATLVGRVSSAAPMISFLQKTGWIIDLDEYRKNQDTYPLLVLPEWIKQDRQAWLVVPLLQQEGLLGFLVLARAKSTQPLNWEMTDLLKTVGKQASSYIALRNAYQQLNIAREFEAFNRMSAYVVHDLKNIVSQLSLVSANAFQFRGNPEFQDDMIETVSHSVTKMTRLLEQLKRGMEDMQSIETLSITNLVRQVVQQKQKHYKGKVNLAAQREMMIRGHADRLERVIGHIIQNAMEASQQLSPINVTLDQENNLAMVTIQDFGIGMDEQFMRSGLFKPFNSTKLDGMGVGAYESKEYVQLLGGRIEVESAHGQGSCFRIYLPVLA